MPNDLVPEEATIGWSELLKEVNLPKVLLGPAGEAMSRLIGRAADIPAEYIGNISQQIKDKREARTEISKALAKAAASEVSQDKDLVHRAAQSFLAKELRSQTNKEAVATLAIKHMAEDGAPQSDAPEAPDDDWINVFERYAEDASSERMRDLWARVLAKEIRKPKSFSLRTMRFVSELDGKTANLFARYSGDVFDDACLHKGTELGGQLFSDFMQLQSVGLLVGVEGFVSRTFDTEAVGVGNVITIKGHRRGLAIFCSAPTSFSLPVILLTDIGREILRVTDHADDEAALKALVEAIPKTNVDAITLGPIVTDGTEIQLTPPIWKKEDSIQISP